MAALSDRHFWREGYDKASMSSAYQLGQPRDDKLTVPRWVPVLRCGQSDDLAAGRVNHQSNFIAGRLDGMEDGPQKLGNVGNVG
jgi:hypothetical protein